MDYQLSRVNRSTRLKAFLLLISLLVLTHAPTAQAQTQASFEYLKITCPNERQAKVIYQNNTLQKNWIEPPDNSPTCRPNPIVQQSASDNRRNIQLLNTNPNPKDNPIHITQVIVTTPNAAIIDVSCSHNSIILDKNSSYLFTIMTKCKPAAKLGSDWGLVNVTLYSNVTDEGVSFYYQQLCGADYDHRFDWGYIILLAFTVILVAMGARSMATIIQNEELKVIHVFIFVAVLTGSYILLYYWASSFEVPATIIFSFMSFLAATFVINNFFKNFVSQGDCLMTKFKVPVLGKMTLTNVFSILLCAALVGAWYWKKNWIIGNLLAICLLFALIKFAKVTSMKVGAALMISVIASHLLWSLIAALFTHQVNSGSTGSFINLPVSLNFPRLLPYPTRGTCFSVNIIECVFPGLFIAFCYRYDKAKGLKLFYVAGMFGFLMGFILHAVLFYTGVITLNPIIYLALCTLACVFIVAFRRNEHKDLWDGLQSEREFAAHLLRNIDLDDKKNPKIPEFDSQIFDSIDLKKQTERLSMNLSASDGPTLNEIRLIAHGRENER